MEEVVVPPVHPVQGCPLYLVTRASGVRLDQLGLVSPPAVSARALS